MTESKTGGHYRDAGVDIELAQTLLDRAKSKLARATRPEVLAPVGGFGGLFQLDLSRYTNPVMVSSVDGVGTKLMVAALAGRHGGVGHDIVNHCIDDIAVQGAEPVYFLDYLGIGKLRSPLYERVLEGLAEACAAQNVALLGGETAEMPGMYGDDYDLVGCITGIVERERMITGESIQQGDVLIGLASNGLHTNGYSLARRVLFDVGGWTVETSPPELGGETIGEALLHPHTCYWPAIRRALEDNMPIRGMAHITGGGVYDNIPRVLPDGLGAVIERDAVPVPPIFDLIATTGDVSPREMYHVFNMGIGMVWMVPPQAVDAALRHCSAAGLRAAPVGEIVSGRRTVTVRNVDG